jgi:Ca2+-binding EF-hand superfamily protein
MKTSKGNPIQRFDKNGDGKISMDEAPPMMKANFSQHDINGDGFIDGEEAKSLPSPGGQGGGVSPSP